MKIFFVTIILLLLCLELPFQNLEYEMARVWVARIGPVFLWVAGLFLIWKQGLNRNRIRPLFWVVLLLGLWGLSLWWSLITGPDPWKSLWGNLYRGDGFFTFMGFGLLTTWLVYFWEEKWLDIFCYLMIVGGLVQLLGELFSCASSLGNMSCSGWMGNSVLVAGFLTMVIPFWSQVFKRSFGLKKTVLLLVGLLLGFGLIVTGTWMAIVGLILLFTCYLQANKYLTLSIILVLLSLTGVLWWQQQQNLGFVAESRERIWAKGLMAFAQRPLLGWGPANFDYAFESVAWPIPIYHDVVVDKAHNESLECLVTGGLSGLSFYLFSWFLIVTFILKNKVNQGFFLLVGAVYIFVSSLNITPIGVQLIYWWLLAMSIISHKKIPRQVGGRD